MKLLTATLAFLFSAFAAFDSHAQAFADADQATRWFTYYYVKPEPERLPEALRVLSAAGLLKEDTGAPPVTGFLSAVFRARPQGARDMVARLSFLPDDEQQVVLLGLWYSGVPDAKTILKELSASMPVQAPRIAFLLATPSIPVVEVPPDQGAWVLDAWWGYFFATGDALPIRAIIAVLPWAQIRGDAGRLLIGGAARWSLTSNAVQHDRVLAICKEQLRAQPGEVAKLLGEVVKAAETERAGKK